MMSLASCDIVVNECEVPSSEVDVDTISHKIAVVEDQAVFIQWM